MTLQGVVRSIGRATIVVALSAGQWAVGQCPNGVGATLFDGSSRGDALVFGVLTDVSRLCVNGLSMQTDGETRLLLDGKVVAPGALSIGQVALIAAAGVGNVLKAVRVLAFHEIVGPVTDIDAAGSELSVMGRRVVLRAGAQSVPGAIALTSLKLGDVVRVSGLRDHRGEIDGTRVELAATTDQSVMFGRFTVDADGVPRMAGVRLRFPDSAIAAPELSDKEVRVSGRWTGRELVVEDLLVDPLGAVLDRSGRVSLQGYLGNDGSGVVLAGLRIRLGGSTRFEGGDRRNLRPDSEVTVTGALRAGRQVEVERIRIAAPRVLSDRGLFPPRNPTAAPGVAR